MADQLPAVRELAGILAATRTGTQIEQLLAQVRAEHRAELGAQLLDDQEQCEAADRAAWGVLTDDTQAMGTGLRRLLATHIPTLETTP